MGRKSSIRKLPPELLEQLNAMLRDGRLSIDALTEFLQGAGAQVSRSAVGRYARSFGEQIEDYRKTQEISKALFGAITENPKGDIGRFASELIKLNVLQTMQGLRAEGKEIPPEEAMLLSAALKNAIAADKTSTELAFRIRKEVAAEADVKMKKLESDARRGAVKLDVETIRRIREEVYAIT